MPASVHESPDPFASIVIPEASHLPFGSVNASVAMVSPEAMPGRSWPCWSSVAAFMIALAARHTVEKYGAQSRTRPISSRTMPSSTKLKPWPPCASGEVEALEAELLGHLRPDRGVVALGGLHEATDLGFGALGLQELADSVSQLLLLVGEREVHGVLLFPR